MKNAYDKLCKHITCAMSSKDIYRGNGLMNFTVYVSDTYTWASDFNIQGTLMRNPPLILFDELSTMSSLLISSLLIILFLLAFLTLNIIKKDDDVSLR